jgi:hypothetical protein
VSEEFQFEVSPRTGKVSAILVAPPNAKLLYVLGHGAGAGMRHVFMEQTAADLAERGVATMRYQFPYMEAGGHRTDPAPVCHETVRAAVQAASRALPNVPLIAGGKSFGGRMTSQAQAKEPLPGVRGLAFLGFPLHPAGKPGEERATHLTDIAVPMLFLQGTRDELAELPLIQGVCARLKPATLHIVAGGDHSFAVLKREGRTPQEVRTELADTLARWATEI